MLYSLTAGGDGLLTVDFSIAGSAVEATLAVFNCDSCLGRDPDGLVSLTVSAGDVVYLGVGSTVPAGQYTLSADVSLETQA